MRRAPICFVFVSLVAAFSVHAQSKLSAKWEELTAADFREAIQLSKGNVSASVRYLGKNMVRTCPSAPIF